MQIPTTDQATLTIDPGNAGQVVIRIDRPGISAVSTHVDLATLDQAITDLKAETSL